MSFILSDEIEKKMYGGLTMFSPILKKIVVVGVLAFTGSMYAVDTWKPQARYAALAARYQQIYAQEEQALLQEFFTLCNITQAEWEEFKLTCKDAYLIDEKQKIHEACSRCSWPVSPAIKTRFGNLLQQSHIFRPIELHRDNSPTYHEMYALQSAVVIDEALANTLRSNSDEVDAGLLHEMAHLRFDDDFVTFCMYKLKNSIARYGTTDQRMLWKVVSAIKNKVNNATSFDEAGWQSFTKRWYHFRERRADIFSGLIDIKYAQAWVAFWKKFKQGILVETVHNDDHPSAMVRHEYMNRLTNEMAQSA